MANIPTAIKEWSTTEGSNQPDGTDSATIAGDFRAIQAAVRYIYSQDTIASGATTDLGSKDAGYLTVTGTTTITSLGTVAAGITKRVVFSGALTLTHNATSLILPGAANITTVAGDVFVFESLGSGNWRCMLYLPTTGGAVTTSNTATLTNKTLTSPTIGGTPSAAGATWSNLGAVTTVDINGGTIDGASIGASTPGSGAFTTLSCTGNATFGDASGDAATFNGATFTFAAASTRIQGDFSNATLASRTSLQSSTTNGATLPQLLPNGTNVTAGWLSYNGSDPANSAWIGTYINTTAAFVATSKNGTGTYVPMRFVSSGVDQVELDTSGNLRVIGAGGLGYGTGSGGTVSQTVSKATAVTLNKTNGQIVTQNSSLAASATVSFTVNNSTIAATDTVICHRVSGGTAAAYQVWVDSVAAGSFVVAIRNTTGGSLSETLTLSFAAIKVVTS